VTRDIIEIRSVTRADGGKTYFSAVKSRSASAVECFLVEALSKLPPGTTQAKMLVLKDGEKFGDLTVGEAGELLRALTAVNNDTNDVYEEIDRDARENKASKRSLFFELDDDVDAIPWETLRLKDAKFVSLNRAPVIRQVQVSGGAAVHELLVPVRFLAILSATPDDGGHLTSAFDEWLTLYAKLSDARSDLKAAWQQEAVEEPLHLIVLTNQEQVFQAAQAVKEGWIEVGVIASEASLRAIRERFSPHIVHVFCHGVSTPGEKAQLILGNRAAFFQSPGNIELAPGFFEGAGNNTWFVTLNACSTAASTGLSNFARLLVKKGIPAALGMREPIDTTQAAAVSSQLYRQFFETLGELSIDSEPVEVDFAAAIPRLLRRLHDATHAGIQHEECWHWSIPRLYVRNAGLRLVRSGARTNETAEALTRVLALEETVGKYREWLLEAPPGGRPCGIGTRHAFVGARCRSGANSVNVRDQSSALDHCAAPYG
jgi:hypothetical protein